jgi:hypothetical protein
MFSLFFLSFLVSMLRSSANAKSMCGLFFDQRLVKATVN